MESGQGTTTQNDRANDLQRGTNRTKEAGWWRWGVQSMGDRETNLRVEQR